MRSLLALLLLLAAGWLPAHGDLDGQIAELDAALAADPDDAAALRRRAELHRQHGDPARALADLERAAALAPQPAADAFARGRIQHAAGELAAARAALEACLALEPQHLGARLELARVAAAQADWATAASQHDLCWQQLDPPRPQHALERAAAHARRPDGGAAAELAALEQGLARLGELPVLLEAAVAAALRAQAGERALALCDRALAQAARPEGWLRRKAEVLDALDRRSDARACRQQALAAIDALPPALRQRPATRRLRAQIALELR